MRTKRLERLLKLLQSLQSKDWSTVEDLAIAAGVSRRTVFRDLEVLASAGIPFRYDHVTRRYAAEKTSLLPPVSMSHPEAMALLMAAHYMLGRPFVTDLAAARSAAVKLQSVLPLSVVEYCGKLLKDTLVHPGKASDAAAVSDILPMLQQALAARKKIHVHYDSYFEQREITSILHLYRLVFIHRGWYMIAYSESMGRVLTFKVERVLQLKLLAEDYRIAAGFSLDAYFGNAWMMIRGDKRYHVKIRFGSKVAANVDEIRWHKTQRTEFQMDGSLLFEVDVDGVDEISW